MDAKWNTLIAQIPRAHILQTTEWGAVKKTIGWEPIFRSWFLDNQTLFAAAMILQRSLPIRGFAAKFHVLYAPKGPLLKDWEDSRAYTQVIHDLEELGKSSNGVFLKIDPDVPLAYGLPGSDEDVIDEVGNNVTAILSSHGWIPSREQVQFRNTIEIDLAPDLDTLLDQMKQKTRYNIRLAQRKGVSIRQGNKKDLAILFQMYAETSIRDGFVIRDQAYYLNNWNTFIESKMLDILVAEVDGEPVAGLLLYHFAKTAWYMHGMSRNLHRDKMPSYLLQWAAIQRAKSLGCTRYDLWGAPDQFSEADHMWGVYKFKEGLGGKIIRNIGAWDYPIRPSLYKLYIQILPRILNLMRISGKAKTRSTLQ
jgi:peptidoglycan pentaglycine glycine transferase (the first glycine)